MNIVTIMNFVRGCEPRYPGKDLLDVPKRQNEFNKKYGFPNTFLLQYDVLTKPEMADFFKNEKDNNMELGVWIEIVRPLTEKVGIKWRGRPGYDWDWFVNPGFLPAYTDEQKEALIDELMEKFKEVYGEYPKTAASWILDAYSMDYMSEKYGISTLAICREQFAVDAYTLWGGPYNQPYYPSKNNMLCPAQSDENRIKAPVFRLLGIEPIRGYWEDKYEDREKEVGGCVTMEPFWSSTHNKDYMEWFFKTYFDNENMGISYAQIGQENSFGWSKIKDGLEIQYELLDKYCNEGKISLMKMSEAGEYFKNTYSDTPAQAIVAEDDQAVDDLYRSVWFSNKYYRANVFLNKGKLMFRDIQKFDDNYSERYRNEPCLIRDAVYDNLPVVNERLWAKSVEESKSGMYFEGDYEFETSERSGDSLSIVLKRNDGEHIKIVLGVKSIEVYSSSDLVWNSGTFKCYRICDDKLCMVNNGYEYSVKLIGNIGLTDDGFILSGDVKEIVLH